MRHQLEKNRAKKTFRHKWDKIEQKIPNCNLNWT